jgi:hypothetical protein
MRRLAFVDAATAEGRPRPAASLMTGVLHQLGAAKLELYYRFDVPVGTTILTGTCSVLECASTSSSRPRREALVR